MPTVDQVLGTLPSAFKEKLPTNFAILLMAVRYSLKLHRTYICNHLHGVSTSTITLKFLVACTPNGAICYISPVFVGSISDVELMCVGGFLTTLQDKPGVSIMADKGFTIKDMLKELLSLVYSVSKVWRGLLQECLLGRDLLRVCHWPSLAIFLKLFALLFSDKD